ncbi:MAG: undecaprenyl-phosphate galactose phosphotransferase WbaP [Pirellulales bacterium]|nr:undecaprenyl-phosphate galactose phosphotransferase WbaP [Pirellulales bacterium]
MPVSEDVTSDHGQTGSHRTHAPVVDPPVAATSPVDRLSESAIMLRGTLRRQSRTPKYGERVRGRVQMPEPRNDGSREYLRQVVLTSLPLLAADLLLLAFAISMCGLMGLQWLNPADPSSQLIVWYPAVATSFILINCVLGLYPGTRLGAVDEIRRLVTSLTMVALINAVRLRPTSDHFSGRVVFLACAFAIALLAAPVFRSLTRKWASKRTWWGFPTLICGDDAAAFGVHQWLADNRRLGLRSLGVITDPHALEVDRETTDFLGPWSEARTIAERDHAFWAIFVDTSEDGSRIMSRVEEHLGNVPHVFVVSKVTGIPDHWNRHEMNEGLAGFQIDQVLQLPIPAMVKRATDLLVAGAAAVMLAPLFLGLSIAIKLTSPGPIFYGHERVGRGNTRFKAWKFRTMVSNADKVIHDYLDKHPELRAEWEQDHKLKNDPRVTKLGKWMRKWSIDELPQVWNVIRGDMSVVGPRPIVEDEIVKYGEHFETFCSVLPGMTGLWQVCGRNDTTYDERVQLDVYYIHHWSPWLDCYLLARTVKTVLFTRGAY